VRYFQFVKLVGSTPTEEDLLRVLPPPWQIVPRCGAHAGMPADEEPYVLVGVPANVTTPREELEQSLYAALAEDRLRIVARGEKQDG
jgi:hypothetical protein